MPGSVKDNAAVIRAAEADPVVLKVAGEILLLNPSLYEQRKKACLKNRKRIHIVAAQPLDVALLLPFLIERGAQTGEHLRELAGVHRFQNILVHLEMHRFLRVLELVEAGEKEHADRRKVALQPSRQLQSVHIRHPDIRHDDVRRVLFRHLQRLHPVRRTAAHPEPERVPVEFLHDDIDDFLLVVDEKHAVCCHGCPAFPVSDYSRKTSGQKSGYGGRPERDPQCHLDHDIGETAPASEAAAGQTFSAFAADIRIALLYFFCTYFRQSSVTADRMMMPSKTN